LLLPGRAAGAPPREKTVRETLPAQNGFPIRHADTPDQKRFLNKVGEEESSPL